MRQSMDQDLISHLIADLYELIRFSIPIRLSDQGGNVPSSGQKFAKLGQELSGSFAIRLIAAVDKQNFFSVHSIS